MSAPPPPAGTDAAPSETLSYGREQSPDAIRSAPDASGLGRGSRVHRYTILDRVGEGGMGVVHAAYDPSLDRRVALKFLVTQDPARQSVREARLVREAQAMARLSHPNVAVVYEVGNFEGSVFLAMEFVDGVDLRAWLAEEPRARAQIMDVFLGAGRGLAAAHAAGIVHRDFKPENVLLDEHDRPRVTDFGLARSSREVERSISDEEGHDVAVRPPTQLSTPLTRTGGMVGTPPYMAPEQHRGADADARADQFAFCVALYEALVGVRPFAGATPAEIAEAIEARRIETGGKAGADVPRWIRSVLIRGLEPRPDDRWPSMEALLAALGRDPRVSRRRWMVGGGVVAGLALAAALLVRGEAIEACPSARDRVAGIWDADARAKVRAAFLATGSPIAADAFGRVERALAGRLDSWVAAHREACAATRVRGEQSDAMLDLRMQCLERARRQLHGLVLLWQDSVDLNGAVQAALTVGDLRDCADSVALAAPIQPPRDPRMARRLDEFRRKLDDIEARRRAGQYREALRMAREVVTGARPLEYPPLLAEALHANATLEVEVADLDTGLGLLKEAFSVANTARDDLRAARVMNFILFTTGARAKNLVEATSLWTFAEAAVARVSDRDDIVGELSYVQGTIRSAQGRWSEATALHEKAFALRRRWFGPDDVRVAQTLNGMAISHMYLGQVAEAETANLQALSMMATKVGGEHPNTTRIVSNLCVALGISGELERASTYCDRLLVASEIGYPPDHPQTSRYLYNVAALRLLQERNEEANALLERSRRIMERAVGGANPDTMIVRSAQAELALKLGAVTVADRTMADVLPVIVNAYGDDHPLVAERLTTWGDVLLRKGDLAGAQKAHERALGIWREVRADHPQVGRSLQGLASVALAKRNYAEAIEQFGKARELVEKGYGPQHPSVAASMTGIGRAHRENGHPLAAVETLERAVSLFESNGVRLGEGDTRFELAQALWATGARHRALAMGGLARDAYSRGSIRWQADRVERWLRAHRRAGELEHRTSGR